MDDTKKRRYRHLTQEKRYQIQALKESGKNLREIAVQLKVSASTIHRELSRCCEATYCAKASHNNAQNKRAHSKIAARKIVGETEEYVRKSLQENKSPDQIAGVLKRDKKLPPISYMTIYRYITRDRQENGTIYQKLRHKGKAYKKSKSEAGRGVIPNRRDISERPAIVETKTRCGDWEIDTIIGANHKGAIVSIVERYSKKVLLKFVPSKETSVVTRATIDMLLPYKEKVLSITSDNGKEFAWHENVAHALNADFFFATPYHSWERGLNEHTNGLVREFLPKKMSFMHLTDHDIAVIEQNLNTRPRKSLKYATPDEVFFAQLKLPPFVPLQA